METDQILEEPTKNKSPWIKCSEENLYQHAPTETYYVRYRLPGRKRTFESLETKVITVARLKLRKRLLEIEETRQTIGEVPSDIGTVGQILENLRRRMNNSKAEPATKKHHEMRFERLIWAWPSDINKTHPKSVTMDFVLKLREKLSTELAPATVNHVLSTLRNILDLALSYCLIVRHPFQSKEGCKKIYLSSDSRVPELPTKEQMLQIFAELETITNLDRIDPHLHPTLLEQAMNSAEHAKFLTFSGCRLNEANCVTWEGIQANRFWVPGTKTDNAQRWVPINPDLACLLKEIRARRESMGIKCEGRVLRVKDSKGRIENVCKRLGLPRLKHHDLRHFFATIAIECGVPIPTVADWMGHADGGASWTEGVASTLLKVYRHGRDEHSTEQAAKVNFGYAESKAARSIPA